MAKTLGDTDMAAAATNSIDPSRVFNVERIVLSLSMTAQAPVMGLFFKLILAGKKMCHRVKIIRTQSAKGIAHHESKFTLA